MLADNLGAGGYPKILIGFVHIGKPVSKWGKSPFNPQILRWLCCCIQTLIVESWGSC